MTLPHVSKFGIYVHKKDGKVVRITSPYWFPEAPDWVMVTPEVNATILKIRELVAEKKLYRKPEEVAWTSIPVKEEDRIRWEAEEREKKGSKP